MTKKFNWNEFTLDNIGVWPCSIKILVFSLVNVLVVLGIYQSDLRLQFKQLQMLRAENINLQQILRQQNQQLGRRAMVEQQLKNLQRLWIAQAQQIFDVNQMANLLADITRLGISNGLQFKSIRPLVEQQSVMTVLPVEIHVEGESIQLVQFLKQLAQFKSSVNLQEFKLSALQRNKFYLILVIHVCSAELTSMMGVRTSSVKTNIESIDMLTTFALDALQMVGHIQSSHGKWALIAAPNHHVYRVTIGDRVGQVLGIVKQIHKDKIEIAEPTENGARHFILRMKK